jgi:signal transduction histidine kinase
VLWKYLEERRDVILGAARANAILRHAPRATAEELAYGLPMFFEQLVGTLRKEDLTANIAEGATVHGAELLRRGVTIAQVVHAYGDLCQAITEIAAKESAEIPAADFGTLNRLLDDAIGHAVTEYARIRDLQMSDRETERLGRLAHELRNQLNSGTLAFEAIKSGRVGAGGSTGAVLSRSLVGLRTLVDGALAEVRLEAGLSWPEHIEIPQLLEDVEVGAALDAREKGIHLVVPSTEPMVVHADRQLLSSALVNLLQNAVKYTPVDGTVSLSARLSGTRVLLDVADACGGLSSSSLASLFVPFQQNGSDRSGLGLGLTIARRAIAACGGELRVADVPGTGCVFTIDLSRVGPV